MSGQQYLPPLDEDLRRDYLQLVDAIDRRVQELTAGRLSGRIGCRPGCSDCCMAFSVLPLEAALLAEALGRQPVAALRLGERCGFLKDGLCRLYTLRPVICRTQGMALAYIDEAGQGIEVSACPLNFPEDAAFEHDDLLFMDQFNERLADLNLRYCQRHGLSPEGRIALLDFLKPSA